jgi:CheY-like chemotaxis protein
MKTVLYVDDSPNDRFLFERACQRAQASFRLKTVQSGGEAIRYLGGEGDFGNRAEHPVPDLIFLDLKMPDMDGFEVLRWIRTNAATRSIAVTLFTGSFIPEDVAKGYSEGANYFISKPPELATLIEILRAADGCLAADPKNCEALARFATPPEPL